MYHYSRYVKADNSMTNSWIVISVASGGGGRLLSEALRGRTREAKNGIEIRCAARHRPPSEAALRLGVMMTDDYVHEFLL